MNTPLIEKRLHVTFEISLLLKGIQAVLEIISGFIVFFTPTSTILKLITLFTTEELIEDPRDLIAQYLIKTVGDLSISGQHFISFYLLSHGVVKLVVIIGLFKNKIWAYPTSCGVFSLFIIYQLYRYTFTHSPWLLLFTVFDIIVIALTIHEYHFLKLHHLPRR